MRTTLTIFTLLFMLVFTGLSVAGDPLGNIDSKLSGMEDRLADQEQKVMTLEQQSEQSEIDETNFMTQNGYAPIGMVTFLFGAFCALWAQDTGRRAWGWFFLGLVFNVFAVIALLIRNSDDIKARKADSSI